MIPLTAQKIHQDLVWALSSPQLIQLGRLSSRLISDTPLKGWITSPDHGRQLLNYLGKSQPKRLGIYFELLWRYLFEQNDRFELLAHNLPVRVNGTTLGEFDFIYYCHTRQQHFHLETAVKFYLGIARQDNQAYAWRQWIGPGQEDRLDLKLNKLLHHQARLSRTEAGVAAMTELGISKITPEICLKGYLFYPLNDPCPAPQRATAEHLTGFWLPLEKVPQLTGNYWMILDKAQWLAPIMISDHESILNISQLEQNLRQMLTTHRFPKMIVALSPGTGCFQEFQRYFVTPDDWHETIKN